MVGVLLCDQSAAFDLCDYQLLIEKMNIMGVDAVSAAWFWSYLSGRRQSCYSDGHHCISLHVGSHRAVLGDLSSGSYLHVINQMLSMNMK